MVSKPVDPLKSLADQPEMLLIEMLLQAVLSVKFSGKLEDFFFVVVRRVILF